MPEVVRILCICLVDEDVLVVESLLEDANRFIKGSPCFTEEVLFVCFQFFVASPLMSRQLVYCSCKLIYDLNSNWFELYDDVGKFELLLSIGLIHFCESFTKLIIAVSFEVVLQGVEICLPLVKDCVCCLSGAIEDSINKVKDLMS